MSTPKKPRPKPEPNNYPAVIETGNIYLAEEFRRRARWRAHSWRQARRKGFPVTRFGSRDYVIADLAIDWFKKLTEEQAGGDLP